MTRTDIGRTGQGKVKWALRGRGRKVSEARYDAPYDLVVDSQYRIEVKTARLSTKDEDWQFNVHRHGKILENYDAYIFRLEDATGKVIAHLFFRAPLKRHTFRIANHQLTAGSLAVAAADYRKFANGRLTGIRRAAIKDAPLRKASQKLPAHNLMIRMLADEYAYLKEQAKKLDTTISDLVRVALKNTYGGTNGR